MHVLLSTYMFCLIHYFYLKKKHTFYTFLAISEDMSLQLFVVFCIKAKIFFGTKFMKNLIFHSAFYSYPSYIATQAVYQELFNTKMLQIITCY